MGLVTGPHARTPRTHSQGVVGPGCTPERTSGLGRESAQPWTPHTQARGAPPPPPGTLMPSPQRAKPARKSARCGVVDGSPRPHPPRPQPLGSGPRPHARKDKWSGVGERPTPEAPHQGKRRPPRAPSCRPHSAQSQLARAHAVGLVTGPHARTPRTHSQWVVGPGCTPEKTNGRGWESAGPRTPRTQASGAPPGRPGAAPTALQASAQGQLARGSGVGLVTGPHARTHPTGSAKPHSQVGGNGTGPPPPPKQAKRSTAPRQDTRRGTDRVERPYQRPAPGPREVRAPHQTGEGGGRRRRESASAHTHKGHAGKTGGPTGPSPCNAQTAWNGIPASEDKGHPDRTARHRQRRKGGAGRGKRGRHNTRHRPQPPRTGRERRTHTTRALHPPRQ